MAPRDLLPDKTSKTEVYEFIRTVFTGVVTSCVIYGVAIISEVSDLAKKHEIEIHTIIDNHNELKTQYQGHLVKADNLFYAVDKRIRTLEIYNKTTNNE